MSDQPDTQPYFRVPPTLGCRWASVRIDADGYQWRRWCVLQHAHDGEHMHITGQPFRQPQPD